MYPNANTRDIGIRSIGKVSSMLVIPFGFSNGCAEFALKNPPPFDPIILIASCEATGPNAIV